MVKKADVPEIKSLYYITHVKNVPSILSQGILSHRYVEDHAISYTPIYDKQIVGSRKLRTTPENRSLWDYANVYFQPRNPMLYRVLIEAEAKNIAIIGVQPKVLETPGAFITDGNAANTPTKFYNYGNGLKAIAANWKTITSEWWNSLDGSKRKIMAECLVPTQIPPELIHSIYVGDHDTATTLRATIVSKSLPVIPEPPMFFLPAKVFKITDHLRLIEGDMFFSRSQTLTVSVNTVGIMGKGLASRAKYQFPDVYVVYQDACRSKKLKMGKPYLYKRESPLDDELTEDPHTLTSAPNGIKWFLLFATKQHWRDSSDIQGIDQGLEWVVENHQAEGITSISLPALGCGLGRLDWKDVGPVMCKHLCKLDKQVKIYLPREREIPNEFLSPEYLMR